MSLSEQELKKEVVDPNSAVNNPFRLYRELTALRHIRRFQRHACVAPISVAEHSFYVGLLAAQFARTLGAPSVNVLQCLEGGLWHDAAEAITGDVPHPVF